MSSRSSSPKPETRGERVQKALARTGVASRREIDRLLQAGRILIDGRPAVPGDRLLGSEAVLLDGRPISFVAESGVPVRAVLAYHKPVGEIATKNDPERRKTVFEALPPAPVGRWISVGRLDINTSGLLLFTTDGELAHRLMHPRYQIDREYAVRVRGALSDSQLAALLNGVTLEDGTARFLSVAEMNQGSSNSWYQVRLREGRNREVRRMFEAIEVVVSRLIRTRYGPIELGRTRRGEVRTPDAAEIDALYRAADLKAASVGS
jgi:23S rRNA pseudouridine2605 synthase